MFSRRTDWKLAPNRFTLARIEYDEAAILDSLRNPKSLDYDPQPKGLRGAREAVAEYYSCGTGASAAGALSREIYPENLILTTSTSEGYSYVFRLLANPGDEVLVPKPSYPLFDFLAGLQDVKLQPYPLIYDHGWQIDLHALERAINKRTRAVIVVHPNNPTGSYVTDAERSALNTFCREHRLALMVDEVFLDYAHDGIPRSTFADNQDALTFTLSGLSKIAGLPQMKLGWIAVSGPEREVSAAM